MQAYTTGKTVEQLQYQQEENRIEGERFKILQEIAEVQNHMLLWQNEDGQLSPLLQQKFEGELARLDNKLIPLDNQLFNLQNPSITKAPQYGELPEPIIPETERQRRKREHEAAKAARKNQMKFYTNVFKEKTKPKAITFRIAPDGRYVFVPTATAGVAYGGIGGLQMAMSRSKGGTFGMGNRRLGTREGNMIEALRQAQMATIDPNARRQRTGIDVSGFEVDRGQANAAELAAYMGGAASLSEVRGSTRFDERNRQVMENKRRQLAIKDRNTNLLRFGGKLREGMSIWDEGAVTGGYSSRKAFNDASKRKRYETWDRAREFADFFSGINKSVSGGRSNRRHQYTAMVNTMEEMKNVLSSAGLGYKRFNAATGLRYRYTMAQYNAFHREWAAVRAYNDNQYAKAQEINLLQEGFGLTGFTGSALRLPELQDEVARQDELIRSIGLNRTEAFQIVDTEGRGREEIDDRIRFKDRMNSMSTGVSVL